MRVLVAQWLERLTSNQKIAISIPSLSLTNAKFLFVNFVQYISHQKISRVKLKKKMWLLSGFKTMQVGLNYFVVYLLFRWTINY